MDTDDAEEMGIKEKEQIIDKCPRCDRWFGSPVIPFKLCPWCGLKLK